MFMNNTDVVDINGYQVTHAHLCIIWYIRLLAGPPIYFSMPRMPAYRVDNSIAISSE